MPEIGQQHIHSTTLRSGAIAVVTASVGLLVLAADRPVLVEADENDLFAAGLRLQQYELVSNIPQWLALPDRSTQPYGNITGSVGNNRLIFRTFLAADTVERYYRRLLSANGFQVAVIRPQNRELNLVALVDAFDATSNRSSQIMIRNVQAVRVVEITYDTRALQAALVER